MNKRGNRGAYCAITQSSGEESNEYGLLKVYSLSYFPTYYKNRPNSRVPEKADFKVFDLITEVKCDTTSKISCLSALRSVPLHV